MGDRPDREDGAAIGLLDVGHVGTDQLVQGLAGNGRIEPQPLLVNDDEVLALVALRRGEHHGVERAAEPVVEAVELEARRAAAGNP